MTEVHKNKTKKRNNEFKTGCKKGIPICLGYIPVSFTFGLMAVQGGFPPWFPIFISITNLTSAGQFAGLQLILQNSTLVEIGITTFIINIRYMLMSLSLSQKISPTMSFLKRALISYGITDETFAVSSMEKEELSFGYLGGLMIGPIFGWTLGTSLGAFASSLLSDRIQSAMGIALYAMFIALVIPASKYSKKITAVLFLSVFLSCLCTWTPVLNKIPSGWKLIVATLVSAGIGATLFPIEEGQK
ncbi:MAG: AzlC family ABC transporter permease [Epulopiscium sp.]|nr:AzlC family ABC transporter permease [Candidatus Epulonipiscium sp.]